MISYRRRLKWKDIHTVCNWYSSTYSSHIFSSFASKKHVNILSSPSLSHLHPNFRCYSNPVIYYSDRTYAWWKYSISCWWKTKNFIYHLKTIVSLIKLSCHRETWAMRKIPIFAYNKHLLSLISFLSELRSKKGNNFIKYSSWLMIL